MTTRKTGPKCNCTAGGPTGCSAPGCEGAKLDIVELVREIKSRPPEDLPGDLAAAEIENAALHDGLRNGGVELDAVRGTLSALEQMFESTGVNLITNVVRLIDAGIQLRAERDAARNAAEMGARRLLRAGLPHPKITWKPIEEWEHTP